jgi:large conductance mechanosensitive channel
MGEFKKFIMRGNVLDLAVGVIIGAAFGKVISSLVDDIFSPLIGLVVGGLNFNDVFIPLKGQTDTLLVEAKKHGPVLAYGSFVTNVINFLIIAFCIFLVVKAANKIKGPEPAAAVVTKDCPQCTMSIPLAAKKCPHCTSVLA